MRRAEFLSLTKQNIKEDFIKVVGKGGKQRLVPINSVVRDILNRNPDINFLKSRKKIWLYRLCCRASCIAGIKRFSPHSMRHFFVTDMLSRGAPIAKVAEITGDKITTLEQIYLHLQKSDIKGATEILVEPKK